MIDSIKVRGARVHNLKAVDVNIPLNQIVGIAGYPALENHRWRSACCMRRAPGVISRRCLPIPGAG